MDVSGISKHLYSNRNQQSAGLYYHHLGGWFVVTGWDDDEKWGLRMHCHRDYISLF